MYGCYVKAVLSLSSWRLRRNHISKLTLPCRLFLINSFHLPLVPTCLAHQFYLSPQVYDTSFLELVLVYITYSYDTS